ncbi:uncharacterized protein BX663DRAFT_428541 [Cokeromyces recurvatus]|uniref:uncharacterized protein n=1 Tax=Cokeromyces recurvatus TaxID=90255 RepID=UPI00222104D9|nr:uncharacterized protein BX663DRAFT_428541 [Cokeromyces recurvatus]KAI7906069.1 hypothetical protein BX663DRAFT_428541 [Cokeromyces recurvatus]
MSNDSFDVHKKDQPPPNWHIVNCTTPAQYFHVLRRQMHRTYRKPLIVASPKSLLKSPLAVSSLKEMAPGTHFQPILSDPIIRDPSKIKKVVFLSGKFYYDLVKEREKRGLDDTIALIRVEELCPFPKTELQDEISKFSGAQEFIWCQEEPQNAGAYAFMAPRLAQILPENKVK